jgi:hypothetical protein
MIVKIILRNLKGLSGTYDLRKNTLLVGASGTGKSGLIDAVKIGLTGYTERGKKPVNTMALASGPEMEVSLESDTGDILNRLFVEKADGTISQTVKINGLVIAAKDVSAKMPASLTFPVESIHTHEFTSLSDDKQAEFIFKALGAEINQIGPDALESKFDFFKKVMPYSDVLELFAQKQSTVNKEIDRCKTTLQKLTGDDAAANSYSGTLQEWEDKKSVLNKELADIVAEIASNNEKVKLSTAKAESRARLQKNITDAEAKIKVSTDLIETLRKQIVEVDSTLPSLASLQQDEKQLIQTITILTHEISEIKKNILLINSAGVCPCCKTTATNLADALFDLDITVGDKSESLEKAQKQLIDLHSKIARAKSFEKNTGIERDIKVENDAIVSYRKSLETMTAEFAKQNESSEHEPVNIEILNAKQTGLKAQIEDAEKAIKAFVSTQAIRKQKSQAEEQRMKFEDESNLLDGATKKIREIRMQRLSGIQDKLRASFDTMIAAVMPDYTAFLNLVKNDKPAFEFGFYNENGAKVPFATACGGEKTILLAALIACIQTLTTSNPGLGLFELAEADQAIIQSFLKALPAVGFEQTISATCHAPSAEEMYDLVNTNAYMTVIQMDKSALSDNQIPV